MKRLFSNTVFSGLEAVTLVALNLVATPVLLNHFGIANYGVFVFLSTFSTYGLLSFFDLGMGGSLLNYVARFDAVGDRRRIQNSLSVTLLFYGVMGVILAVTLYFSAGLVIGRFTDDTGLLDRALAERATRFVAASVFLQFLTLPFVGILQGLRRYVITKTTSTVLMTVQYLVVIAIAVHWRRIDLAYAAVVGIAFLRLVTLALLLRYRVPHFRPMRFELDFRLLKELFSFSAVLLVSRIVGLVFNQMAKFLIWYFLAASSMAIYDVVTRPANLVRILFSTMNSAVVPEVAALHERGESGQIRRLYVNLVRYCYLIVLPILVVLYIHLHGLLTLWVGADMAQYYRFGLIILTVYLLAPIASVASTMAIGLQIVNKVIRISIVASIINIIFSVSLLHVWGLAGLLCGTLVAEAYMVWPYFRAMSRLTGLPFSELARPLGRIFLTALIFAAGNLLAAQLVSGVGLLVLVVLSIGGHYAVSYAALLSPEERRFLLAKARGRLPFLSTGGVKP